MKRPILIVTGIIILVAISVGWSLTHKTTFAPTDGTPLPVRTEDLTNVQIGKTSQANTDVSITPLQIIEDSRCPANVNCIWAGRFVVKAKITEEDLSKEYNFTEGERVVTDFGEIALTKVVPVPVAGDRVKPEDYRFTFHIER